MADKQVNEWRCHICHADYPREKCWPCRICWKPCCSIGCAGLCCVKEKRRLADERVPFSRKSGQEIARESLEQTETVVAERNRYRKALLEREAMEKEERC